MPQKMFHLSPRTYSNLIPLICEDFDVDIQLHLRVLEFAKGLMSSSNCCTRLCRKLAINGSHSELSNSINFIFSKYNLNKYHIADMPASDALLYNYV